MGCIRRLGCLVIFVVGAAAAWYYRDRLPEPVRRYFPGAAPVAEREAPGVPPGTWEPVTAAGGARTREALNRLSGRSGPVFQNISAGDLVSFVVDSLARQLPPSARNVQASIIGDRVYVRADVDLKDFGGAGALGPLGAMLGSSERMQLGGRFHIVRPGLAQFLVEDIKLRDFAIPAPMIPRLMRSLARGQPRPEGVADNGLPLAVPPYIADVRVAGGKITLYKTAR